jgi:hypothetical protein
MSFEIQTKRQKEGNKVGNFLSLDLESLFFAAVFLFIIFVAVADALPLFLEPCINCLMFVFC